ncbi:Protocadherin gamma-C5 [Collichthys lucidus]|uniref:Protocadherin gamma-C5 n=1 Tax=Collichthys lucidus TaxID=240159 RepID=A0A4U5UG73_COLLU|nr:Protocadherin gamma-C5 [Collichthys lucidus]
MTKRKGYRDWRWQALWWHHFFLLWTTIEGQTRYSIPEELKQGSVVGNLAKDLGLGLSDIFDRKLRVASEAGEQYFSVDAGKGELVVNDRIDREALCGQSASCVLPLQVVLEKPLNLHRIEVEIKDINDNSPSFHTKELSLKISETAAIGTRFPLEGAEDSDVGSNSIKSYVLTKNDCFTLKMKEVEDGKTVPELVLEKPLDRERKAVYQLLLTALDGGNPVMSGTSQITITVLDVNDNFPVFEKNIYKVSLWENTAKDTFVTKITATDADEGPNAELNFSFGSQITAKDKGFPEMESHCRLQIDVLDVNDNTPEIVLTSEPQPVREDAPSGTVVALLNARDSDSCKVTLQLPKGSPFTLKPSFSNNYALVTSGPLDRESFSEYNIEITATDSGSPSLSSKKIIPVSITDVNDNPPIFTQPSYNVYLKENGVAGSILYSVSASDLDFGENGKVSYSILDSKVQDVSVSSYVYINSDNGSIYSMHSFDYEKLKVFQIQVQAKDQGSPSLSSNATVHVFILDQNDNAPAVIYPSSAAPGSLSPQRMPRSAKAGHLVTKVTAVDADSGHNAWISYKLAEATDASLFTVNLYTGEVRTKRAVSEQDDSSQRLLIEVKDDGEPVQSATATVSILLEDGLHEPVLDLRHKAAEPSKKNGRITLYLILSLASVSVLSLVTFLILTVKCMRNSRSSGSCCTRRTDYDDYKNPNRNLQIQLNTDGPIKYVEVLGGDMLSQSQSFRSCMSPMSEYSDFTLIKPSSTTDFKEVISVLDASLPDSTWTFESQQTRYSIPEELKQGSVVGNLAKDLGLGLSDIFDRKLRVASEAGKQYFSVDAGKGELLVNDRIDREALCGQSASCVLTLQVVIDKPLQLHRVEVEIQDINDNSPKFPFARYNITNSRVDSGREKKPTHQLQLTAIDGGNPVKSGTSQITINVLDNNDNFPVFEKNIYKVSINENSVQGTSILKLTAKDVDEGPNGEVEYSFGTHTPDIVLSVFDIDSITGEISLKGKLDFETNANYEIDICARDKGTPRMEGHCTVHIEVLDVNDNAPNIFLTSQPNSVPEDAPSGTVVALISARDLDSGDNGKKTINVSVTDVNDNPPIFTQPSYNVYLKENGVAGSILYSVSASDLDFGENAKISYSILDSKVQDVSVSSYVYINSDNGSIYSMHSFDYEKLKVFQIQVQAKDQGSPSLSSNATVHVFILDQNDNAPAVIYPSSAAPGSLSPQRMPRSAKAGHLVTKVTAVDADSGHNAWISYKLAEATDASLFTVNLYTGEVRTKRAVSEQDDSSQRLLIEVKDDGEPVQSATATVSILLEDGLHEPVLDLRHKAAEPSKKNGRIALYLILSLASVSVLSLVTFLILTVKCMRNSRSSGSCCTRRTDYDDYKNPNRNLQIQLNTDGPIKYVEVLGGDMLSQSQSFRSCMSPMSEYSDFTLIKPSSTTDFKEVISVLDASLPDSTWTFESQQVSRKD